MGDYAGAITRCKARGVWGWNGIIIFLISTRGLFPRENAISLSNGRAFRAAYYSGRVNGWKLPKIAGNRCARVAAPPKRGRKGVRRARKEVPVPLRQLRVPVTNYCADIYMFDIYIRSMNADVMDGYVEPWFFVMLQRASSCHIITRIIIIVSNTVFHASWNLYAFLEYFSKLKEF